MKRSLIERKLGKVEKALDKAIEKQEIPGAVVLAQMPREGERLEYSWVRGLAAARPERLPMRRDTIFDLASLTKPMATTTAIMMLIEEGSIALDDPVAKTLPTFADRGKEAVTIRHLLTHSAGLKPWREFHDLLIQKERKTGERLLGTKEGRDWILDRVLRGGLVHEPGAAAVYGDLDFIVLAALVEEVSKQPFDEFCESRIFTRLGLVDTRFFPIPVDGSQAAPDAVRRRVAATENCSWRERILWGEVHDPNASAMGGVAGHAGLFSTADDVMRFGQLFLDAYYDRNPSLPPRTRQRVLRKAVDTRVFGLGAWMGYTDCGRLLFGTAFLSQIRRPSWLHGDLHLDRSRTRVGDRDAHEIESIRSQNAAALISGRGSMTPSLRPSRRNECDGRCSSDRAGRAGREGTRAAL